MLKCLPAFDLFCDNNSDDKKCTARNRNVYDLTIYSNRQFVASDSLRNCKK